MSKSEAPGFSRAAENNKFHILEQLKHCLKDGNRVLEIASGTAQHALLFSQELPKINWQPTDVDIENYRLREVIAANPRKNLGVPFNLDVSNWPNIQGEYDAVYSANCVHIIDWKKVEAYISGAAKSLKLGGAILFYGPFKYGGKFTTKSNEQFSKMIEQNYHGGGIRDFEAIDKLARNEGLVFESDTAMPANNQFLIWRK